MSQLLGVSKSGCYEWKKRPVSNQQKPREKLTAQTKRIFIRGKRQYGIPNVTRILLQKVWKVSQKKCVAHHEGKWVTLEDSQKI